MRKEKKIVMMVLLLLVVVVVATMVFDLNDSDDEKIIGGDRDENNCLISAGYVFDEEIGACIRGWEISDEDSKKAAETAVDFIGEEGLTVVGVEASDCLGCFVVTSDIGGERVVVNLDNWEINEEEILDVVRCTAKGGRVVDSSLGFGCGADEIDVGCVGGCVVGSICCVDKDSLEE